MGKYKYFWKHFVFIVLRECNLNSTTALWICMIYYMKPNCTICSKTFFHFIIYMHTQKIKYMSEISARSEIKCCEGACWVAVSGTGFWDSIYLSSSHNMCWFSLAVLTTSDKNTSERCSHCTQQRLQLSAPALQPKLKTSGWIQNASVESPVESQGF